MRRVSIPSSSAFLLISTAVAPTIVAVDVSALAGRPVGDDLLTAVAEAADGTIWATMDSGRNKGYEDSDTEGVKWDGIWSNVFVRIGWGWAYDGNNMVQMWGDSGMWDDFEVVPFGRYTHSAYLRSNSDDPLAGAGGRMTVVPEDYDRLQSVKINDLGFVYDPFGLEIESAMMAYAGAKFIYT